MNGYYFTDNTIGDTTTQSMKLCFHSDTLENDIF